MNSEHVTPPTEGEKIEVRDGEWAVPDEPKIPQIRGDGIGVDVSPVARDVLSKAARLTGRDVHWFDLYAGDQAVDVYGTHLPDETLETIEEYHVCLKGPLTTPVGGGIRSLNVRIRQLLDLYVNLRPVFYLDGMPSPMKHPEKMDIVVFRENTEDVYSGIEWEPGSREALKVIDFLRDEMGEDVRRDSGIGIKPMSEFASKRLIRRAIRYATERDRESVTLVHKGNIMKYTEGAFRDWGYELADEEFSEETVTEEEVWQEHGGEVPEGKVLMKDRIADNMLQQLVTRTDEYDVLALPNLNGDYVSDAAGGQVGGLGVAPGANLGEETAVFEPVHGTAPRHAGKDKVNPTAMILTGRIMFQEFGWFDAATLLREALEVTIKERRVTYDVHRQLDEAEKVSTSEFGSLVGENMESLA